jgi:small multidrug resistance family-3 protein
MPYCYFYYFIYTLSEKIIKYRNPSMLIVKSLLYFLLAGLCEIGGGYLMWLWLREGRSLLFGLSGAAILIVYGIVPTLQPEGNFGRVYAAYGGIFIALSILWGWLIDNVQPDCFDIIGGIVALTGVAIIMYAPR